MQCRRKGERTLSWVNAKELRECKDVSLPKFQDVLHKRPNFLKKIKVTRQKSVQGEYTDRYLTISHR